MTMKTTLLASCACLGLTALASAQTFTTIASESFEYANGSLNAASGGAGWLGAWNGPNATVTTPGFDALGGKAQTVVEHGGNSRRIDAALIPSATMLDVNGNPAFGVDGTTVWLTWSQQRVGMVQDYGGLSLMGFQLGEKLFLGSPGGTSAMGVDSAFCCGGPSTSIAGTSSDNLHELVVKIEFNAGAEDVTVWLDPAVPHPDPGVTPPDLVTTAPSFLFNEIRLQSGSGLGSFAFDSILLELEEVSTQVDVFEVAVAGGILVGGPGSARPGYSLFVSDDDLAAPGTSTCYGACANIWPPLLVHDGLPSGVPNLGTILRNDGSLQVTHAGRPLYFLTGDRTKDLRPKKRGSFADKRSTVSIGADVVPLYDENTILEPPLQEDTPTALITRLSDRARDRHAREDQFKIYDHYLSFYWEHRTAAIEIVDTIPKGGNTITFNVASQWPLNTGQAELRFLYRGHNTVAEYHNNGVMTALPGLTVPGSSVRHYTRSISHNVKTGLPFQVGDRLEFELSQFLSGVPNGRNNYYGTAILYVVGQGIVPWEARGVFGDFQTELEDSFPMPMAGWLGGGTTLPYQYSDEPDHHFIQMAPNLSSLNGQRFVEGRRVHHTDFGDGSHDEAPANPIFADLAGLLGTRYINRSCIDCHQGNGRALPPAVGQPLSQYVVRVGDLRGGPDPQLGAVLQPNSTSCAPEASVTLAAWSEANGLRSPNYSFAGPMPSHFGARIAPQLVGMGLLDAIEEDDVAALADPNDTDADGISGRMRRVVDAETGETRMGRFGWKASQPNIRQQVAAALNTDIGVMSSVFPSPDLGSQQAACGSPGQEISDEHLEDLTAYIALLGVSARRDLADPQALAGEALFNSANCNACHVETFQTSPFHPNAELRDQTIHPYTDLLLHDMGPGLASTLREGDATGAEWRTPPLWNIGLTSGVSGGEAYLHDGRARSLHEAILWHDGEGAASRGAYESMSLSEKAALIAFLSSL